MRRLSGWGIAAFLFSLLYPSLEAVEPDLASRTSNKRAAELVEKALNAEINGDLEGRASLLNAAIQVDAQFAPALWYSGQVMQDDSRWLSVSDAIENAKSNKLLTKYDEMRAKQPASVLGNWQAAQWCSKNNMPAQCRAHLENILLFDSGNIGARKALGHRQVNDEWMSAEDQIRFAERTVFVQRGFAKHKTVIDQLFHQALFGSPKQQSAAYERLNSIDDPLAIPVMEAVANNLNSKAGEFVVEWLGAIDHAEAALSLARIAMFYPDTEIKRLATIQLKSIPLHDFVPDLLQSMASPIQFNTVPFMNTAGFIEFRQSFVDERSGERRFTAIDHKTSVYHATLRTQNQLTTISKNPMKPNGQKHTFVRINFDELRMNSVLKSLQNDTARVVAMVNEISVLNKNVEREATNQQIAELISSVAGREFPTVPQDVWKWWDLYNETDYQAYKPLRQNHYVERSYVPIYEGVRVAMGSCFVAGTKVCTNKGSRSIEQLLPGDLVLSKDIETGQLLFKPVIATTTRNPVRTVILKVDNETIHATTSHLLWVSGKGWTKAGETKVGDLLHAASEPAVVMSTTLGDILPTHNLIVADTHTYFVGSCRVLSHDVLPRGSVHELVPGQFIFSSK